jgi:hypothetical protein
VLASAAPPPGGRANNYGVPSTVPGDDPVRRVDFLDLEDLAEFGARSLDRSLARSIVRLVALRSRPPDCPTALGARS